MPSSRAAGFSLIELLIVIGIVAGISVVVILTLNPAELLRQSRDGVRLSDLHGMNESLRLYAASGGSQFGLASTTYISLADPAATSTAGTDCSGLGLPPAPSGYAYRCAASSTLFAVNGTGWLPVNIGSISGGAPISRLPVDPQTGTSSYYSYTPSGEKWKLAAALESAKYRDRAAQDGGSDHGLLERGSDLSIFDLRSGWVEVPGSSLYGTSDFLVMKYEARNLSGSPGSVPFDPPWAGISYSDAVAECASIGAHLLTNGEWMTIARNVEGVSSNWTGGAPGSGAIFAGHTDNNPSSALAASSQDDDGYRNTGAGSGASQRRTLALANGKVIWDMAGNVWELLRRNPSGDLVSALEQPEAVSAGTWRWSEFTELASYGGMSYDLLRPSNNSWNSTSGIGRIYHCDACADPDPQHVFVRGGAWGDAEYAGVFAADMSWTANLSDSYAGFRCARPK